MSINSRLALATLGALAIGSVAGCASPRANPDAAPPTSAPEHARGVVEERVFIPRTNRFPYRERAAALGGTQALWLVDNLYESPQHYAYRIVLDDGRAVTLRHRADIPLGVCVAVRLEQHSASGESGLVATPGAVEPAAGCTSAHMDASWPAGN